jgi:drug/metabolite transporter (DMT)-like permease
MPWDNSSSTIVSKSIVTTTPAITNSLATTPVVSASNVAPATGESIITSANSNTNNGNNLPLFCNDSPCTEATPMVVHQQLQQTYEKLLLIDRIQRWVPWYNKKHSNFIWCGIFNACDFLASNVAFSFSSAHFVETIKASEPITTTAIALLWKVDRLSFLEGTSIALLIFGVLLSTWGNSTADHDTTTTTTNTLAVAAFTATSGMINEQKLMESIQTASLAIGANISFGFRAIHQKKYRFTTHEQLDDINFLCRMMQVGACFLIIPTIVLYSHLLGRILYAPTGIKVTYICLAFVNATAYITYKYVLRHGLLRLHS